MRPLTQHRCGLGEGPVWDHPRRRLYWVDSLAARLYCHRFDDGTTGILDLPGSRLGSLAPRERGGLILAMDHGFYACDPDSGSLETIAEPLAGRVGLCFNDGKVDPFGAFVAGAMNIDPEEHRPCPVLRLSPELEARQILDGFDCFNGPCFSAGGEVMYATGRVEGVIEAWDYAALRAPRNRRRLVADCNPDGATVDADGFIWSAQWDHECLLRIAPDGRIDRRLSLAGHVVSSLIFGGPRLDLIFVTTVGAGVYGARPRGADRGRLLVIEGSGYRGRAEPAFKG